MTLMTLFALTGTAEAAADLEVSLNAPSSVDVDVDEGFSVRVENTGNRNAQNVELVVLLPETNTSPTVHVLGEVSSLHSRCVQVDTTLECDLGRVKKGKSKTITFDFAAPWADVDLDIDVYATTTSSEPDQSDNDDGVTLDVVYVDQAITGPAGVTNRHCTGTDLTAFFECELYPSSISSHDILLEADGSITFPGASPYTGSWWQDSDDHLHFEYELYGVTRLEFDGHGVGGDTFEGIATFPGTGYNAGYEVYFREL